MNMYEHISFCIFCKGSLYILGYRSKRLETKRRLSPSRPLVTAKYERMRSSHIWHTFGSECNFLLYSLNCLQLFRWNTFWETKKRIEIWTDTHIGVEKHECCLKLCNFMFLYEILYHISIRNSECIELMKSFGESANSGIWNRLYRSRS